MSFRQRRKVKLGEFEQICCAPENRCPCCCTAHCPSCHRRCLGGHANYPESHWCATEDCTLTSGSTSLASMDV